jgi:hypothetical protein
MVDRANVSFFGKLQCEKENNPVEKTGCLHSSVGLLETPVRRRAAVLRHVVLLRVHSRCARMLRNVRLIGSVCHWRRSSVELRDRILLRVHHRTACVLRDIRLVRHVIPILGG